MQLFFEDVAIAVFRCCNIPPIDIDECCKKHGANVAVGFFFGFGVKMYLIFFNIARGDFYCCRYFFPYVTDVMFSCYGGATERLMD